MLTMYRSNRDYMLFGETSTSLHPLYVDGSQAMLHHYSCCWLTDVETH